MLVTHADAAAYAGVADDPAFKRLHLAVEKGLKRYCGREFEQATYTEIVAGYGHATVFLRETPIHEITEVRIDASGAFGEDTALDADALALMWWAGPNRNSVEYRGGWFPEGRRVARFVYSAGYFPTTEEDPELAPFIIPEDLQELVLELVKLRVTTGGTERFASESFGSHSFSRFAAGVDPVLRAEINRWKRVA